MQVGDDLAAMGADRAAARHILLGDAAGLREGAGEALGRLDLPQVAGDPVERPAQVDGRRAGRGEHRHRPVDPLHRRIRLHGKRQPVGRGDADQRRAAHDHGADRQSGVVERGEPLQLEREGQARLVDHLDADAVRVREDRAIGRAVDIHAGFCAIARRFLHHLAPGFHPRRVPRDPGGIGSGFLNLSRSLRPA
jgi:hypothetical protein